MRRAIFCTSLVLVALWLLGCGSSGSGTTSTHSVAGITGQSALKAIGTGTAAARTGTSGSTGGTTFAARADAICTRYQEQRRSAFRQLAETLRQRAQGGSGGGPGTLAQKAAAAYKQAVASGRRQLAELRTLPPPPGKAATVHAYLASVSAVLDDLERLASNLAAHGARGAARRGGHLPQDVQRTHRLAEQLGMKVCGQQR